MLNGAVASYKTYRLKRQVMSSSEAELIGMVHAGIKSTAMNSVLLQFSASPKVIKYNPKKDDPLKILNQLDIYGDCKPAIQAVVSLNPGKMIENIGHLDYRLAKIRELSRRGAVKFQHVAGAENLADIMTKLVTGALFERFTEVLLNTKGDVGFSSRIGN